MKLEWMGDNRKLVEALIKYCNIYAGVYKLEKLEFEDVQYSYAQIQVLEYLLENEDLHDNMSTIASRLGITKSNFTKIVNRLESKGLVTKSLLTGSKKEILVNVNDKGKKLYMAYTEQILRCHFAPMFKALNRIPADYRAHIAEALTTSIEDSTYVNNIKRTSK
ncbi:MAG: MarR family transcriptional regulator [Lachnospiraceae bacterium]|nr:MarR family transcriptional regulator [Lachnospiraceae bacterium]